MRRILNKRRTEQVRAELAPFEAVLVGRPNCGKSAIWNRLIKKNDAIVSAIPGTTRDRREGKALLGDLEFKLIDTGGLEDRKGEITEQSQLQTKYAVEESDAIIFCVDAKQGITRDDEHFARFVRKLLSTSQGPDGKSGSKTTLLLANKSEGKLSTTPEWDVFLNDCRKLGFGMPVPFSAIHGEGLADLHDALLPAAIQAKEKLIQDVIEAENTKEELDDDEDPSSSLAIKLTILGRPNSGKSTLLNTIVGHHRVVVGATPGVTRDAIEVSWTYEDRPFTLVDTAGWRSNQRSTLYKAAKRATQAASGKAKYQESSIEQDENQSGPFNKAKRNAALLEGLSVERSLKALKETHVACLVIDLAETGLSGASRGSTPTISRQDLAIAGKALEEGKPLIVVANKIDRIRLLEEMKERSKGGKKYQRKLSVRDEFYSEQEEEEQAHDLDIMDRKRLVEWINNQFSQSIPQWEGCPVILTSALEQDPDMVNQLMSQVIDMERRWSSRVNTAKVNRWVREVQERNPPPSGAGVTFSRKKRGEKGSNHIAPIPVKLKFAAQVSTRPPTFAVFVNRHNPDKALDESYQRYLKNQLRLMFHLQGIPVRILVRSSGNPFVDGRFKSQGTRTTQAHDEGDRPSDTELVERHRQRMAMSSNAAPKHPAFEDEHPRPD